MWIIILYLLAAGVVIAEEHKPLPQEGEYAGGVIKLTRPDGTAIYVNPQAVAFIRGPLPGEHGHTTVVFAGNAKQTVLESVDEIGRIMDAERKGSDGGP